MAIDIRKYVNIVSGVGAGVGVKVRDLITRIFVTNVRVDPNSVLEFTDADSVGKFFGTSSFEYLRAVFYFGWVSPVIGQADKLSFARYVNAAAGAAIFGGSDAKSLTVLQAATAGKIMFVVDGVQVEVTIPTLAGAASFAAIATILQTAIAANANPGLAGSTVTYDATRNSFVFQAATASAANSVKAISDTGVTTANDLGTLLEWTQETGANFVGKAVVKTPVQTFVDSANLSNNFGSFLFPLVTTLSDIIAIGQTAEADNVDYQYLVALDPANASTWSAALINIGGLALTLQSPTTAVNEFPEMIPGILLAATDYERRAAVMNPMYKQFSVTPSVTDTATSDAYDALRVNYYGQTQNAGQQLAFYQRGKLMGDGTSPTDMNIFGNEQWLKSDATSQLMELQLNMGQISANVEGIGQVLGVLQDTVDKALRNGVIATGKPFNITQKTYITNQTGDELAWHQVQGSGYWLDAEVNSEVETDGSTEYRIDYTLIYSKNDAVRKINGTHILI